MANKAANQKPPVIINSVDNYEFGDVSSSEVSTVMFHIVSSSFSGSITVKARARGTTSAYAAIPYISRHLNGSVSDDSSASTAITGTSIIEVDAAGLDISLDCTSFASGSMSVTAVRMVG